MIIAKTKDELHAHIEDWKSASHRIGFVPTMGALHDGHLSLCEIAAKNADKVVLSIFVNPTQFAPHEDLESYPRTLEDDLEKLEAQGLVDLVYAPRAVDIYPDGPAATLKAGEAAQDLESDFRPHFFDGVVSVVQRLFNQVRPDAAIFGEKDFQQLKVIQEMTREQGMDIEIIGAPIIRDEMGLALSSRNAYLSEGEIEIARMLNQILYSVAYGIAEGIDAGNACNNAAEMLLQAGFDDVDYVAYKTDWSRVLVAAWIGKTRLIDNCPIETRKDSPDEKPLLLTAAS